MTTTSLPQTNSSTQILKTDSIGRIRFPAEMREELLDRFESSGMSGAEFAAYYNITYSTFATWRQKRERDRKKAHPSKCVADSKPETFGFVEITPPTERRSETQAVTLRLPAGATLQIENREEACLAAELLKALEKSSC